MADVVITGASALTALGGSLARQGQTESEQQELQGIASLQDNDPSVSDAILSIVSASHSSLMAKLINNLDYSKDPRAGYMAAKVEADQAAEVSANSMSSSEISNELYSGGSISAGSSGQEDSMQDYINALINSAASNRQDAADISAWEAGGMTGRDDFTKLYGTDKATVDSYIKSISATADREQQEATGIAAAYADHTLTMQKATDVQGLDYNQNFYESYSNSTDSVGYSEHYNTSFYNPANEGDVGADGEHHTLTNYMTDGLVMMYLSW